MATIEKTPCASAVLSYFGASGATYNNRTHKNVWNNTLRRAGFGVRSRMSKLGKAQSVGAARSVIKKISKSDPQIIAFICRVNGHVMVIDRDGQTIVDTASRKRDCRKVIGLWAVI
jgi:hypothetical protein